MAETANTLGTQATLPDMTLTFPDGRPVRLSELRQNRNLVAVFSGGAECGPCRHAIMSDVCGKPEEYEQAGATPLLVLHCSSAEAELVRRREDLTLPVLLDQSGEVCRAVGAQLPDGVASTAIIVTDCSGRIYLESRPDQNDLLPTRDAILGCLRSIPSGTCEGRGKQPS